MLRSLAVPLSLARVAFLSMLAYRLRFYTGVATYLIYVAVYTSIWRAVHANPDSSRALAEFGDFPTLFTYFAIGWLTRSFLFNNVDRDLADLVETGQLATRVARPVSLHAQLVFGALGETAFRLCCFSPLIALALFLFFDLSPPASPLAFLLFTVALALGIVILIELNFLVGLISFRTRSIQGVVRAKQYAVELFSGLLIPLSYFPEALRTLAELTPFPTLTSIPNRLYLGLIDGAAAARALGFSLAWAIVLVLAADFAGRRASRSISIQGG